MSTGRKQPCGGINRRTVIGGGLAIAGTVLGSGLSLFADRKISSQATGNLVYTLPASEWENVIDQKFYVRGYSYVEQEGGYATLTLLEAAEVVPSVVDEHRPKAMRQFATSLLFRASGKVVLEDASYRMRHPWFGRFDLFLSKVQLDRYPGKHIYQTIINN